MNAAELFHAQFGRAPDRVVWTPGRVNLIGEHVDYNGGLVLPMAIARGVDVAIGDAPAANDVIEIASPRFGGLAAHSFAEPAQGLWSDYVLGAALKAFQLGARRRALQVAISADLPDGAGLSSSAALIVGILRAMLDAEHWDGSAIAAAAREVENEFIGVPCGIMDQMAVALAAPGEAIALDCRTLAATRIPVPQGWRFAVFHSGEARALADGRYAARRRECEDAARRLGVRFLCGAPPEALAAIASLPPPLAARARHAASEDRRARAAAQALRTGDAALFARLMDESHQSMRDDFEVTTPRIDRLVAASRAAGALGARMTGGGFGGCIVSLVEAPGEARWMETLARDFPDLQFLA